MNLFIEKHQQLLRLFLIKNVEFIIIGGYAVIYHGYHRTTGDVDIWLKPSNENRERLYQVFQKMDFDQNELKELKRLDFTKTVVFSIWEEPEKVDFLTKINLVNFGEANQQKITIDVDGLQIPFLQINHLVLSKMNTGRMKDKSDVEELQKIIRLKNEK